MAANNHLIKASICSLFLLTITAFPSSSSASTEEHYYVPIPKQNIISVVVVEGIVYCQKCQNPGSLTGATPIPYAKVNVNCRNSRHMLTFQKVYTANQHGYFFAQLDGFRLGHGIFDIPPLQACTAKLVSSPLRSCNVATEINSGPYGATLRSENKVYKYPPYETVIYAAGPLAFRPSNCY